MKEEYSRTGLEIAVIGIAGRFPGAKNILEFWDNLKNGIESITFLSDEELDEVGVDLELRNNPDFVNSKGGILEDKELFDASFFDYLPREAEVLDPQIRIFHEVAWEALEDAGYAPNRYNGLIGFFGGATYDVTWPVLCQLSGKSEAIGHFAASQLSYKDYLCTHTSFKLNLKGPSVSVHTACSTSLVAIHLACQAILNGECEMALAGGVSVSAREHHGYIYQEGMIASPDGHCRAFDEKARGTVSGSGAGIVLLKLLEDAVNDGDYIYALVKGTAINNDGIVKAGFSAPSVKGQAEVIKTAQELAEVDPESIGYIETHGTGTSLGDPIEVEALKLAFNTDKKHFCRIGSIKTNVGHLDTAAGVTGFIKAVLTLKHKSIPPNLHFETPNSKIDFENSPFVVNAELTEWKNDNGSPLRAGVSSFGLGGTNAHAILEEAPEREDSPEARKFKLLMLSARTALTLDKAARNLAGYLRENPEVNLADIAYTLQVGRKVFEHRKMLVCSDVDEAVEALSTNDPGNVQVFCQKERERPVVFMFSGQGSQYVNMGLELYQSEPVFREEMDRCFNILKPLMAPMLGVPIKEILYPSSVSPVEIEQPATDNLYLQPAINQTEVTQPILFAFEYALAKLLIHWGIKPDAMIGHSIGEYTAAYFAGVFSLEDGLKLAALRGKLMQQMPTGSMLSVPVPEEDLIPFWNENISLGAVNGPSLCVVSGPHEAIDSLAVVLKEKGYESRRLHTSHAFHSKMMEPILEDFKGEVERVTLNKPTIPYISCLTGTWVTGEAVTTPEYWTRHLRETVRFSDGLEQLFKKEGALFLEVGPGSVLSTFTRRHSQRKPEQMVINFVRHSKENIPDTRFLLTKIGQLWLYGKSIDWPEFYGEEKRYRVPLPTYPFERQRYWIEGDPFKIGAELLMEKSSLRKSKDIKNWFYTPSWKRSSLSFFEDMELPANSGWLVFMDELGLGDRLVHRLKQEGQAIISVRTGPAFTRVNDEEYTVNPVQEADYNALFTGLHNRGEVPVIIVHLWGVAGSAEIENEEPGLVSAGEAAKKAWNMGFYSLLYQARAIGNVGIEQDLQIMVVTDQMQEVTGEETLCPAKAPVLGAVKVIPQEYPNIRCRSIDVASPVSGNNRDGELVSQLLMEFSIKSPDTVIAYRGSHRWVQTFEPIPPTPEDGCKDPRTCLKDGGVYLVTGGIGNIGLVLAEYLAKAVKARLVLTGRSDFPPREQWEEWLNANTHDENDRISRKIKKLKEIEAMGAEVLVTRADVTDYHRMEEVLCQAAEQFGSINGVIHAAGITGKNLFCAVNDTDRTIAEHQFRPKVEGLLVLEKVLRGKEPDFCLLMSSLSSVLGGLGFISYSAANSFMDYFVLQHNRCSPVCWTSVDWDGWKFKRDGSGESNSGSDPFELAMTPGEGLKVFECILSWNHAPQIVVSTGDIDARIKKWIRLESSSEDEYPGKPGQEVSFVQERPGLSTIYAAPRNPLEQDIAHIWQKFFGIEPIGIMDDFFELGGDSLKAVTVAGKLHKELHVVVPLEEFFNRPTIKQLSQYINSARKSTYSSIERAEEKEYYPLSSAQKRLYILQQMEPGNVGYNQTQVVLLEGSPAREELEKAFRQLIRRHEVLRTSIVMIDGQPVQKIHGADETEFAVSYHETGEQEIPRILKTFVRPFDLSRAPFFRTQLVKVAESRYILMIDVHHLITDGVSFEIFIKELMALYGGGELSTLKFHYKDYSEWQNSEIQQERMKSQEEYWLKEFDGEIPLLDIPTDYPRPVVQDFSGDTIGFQLGSREKQRLKELGVKEDVTLFMVVLALFYVFLSKLSGQEDIVVGTPVAGRGHPDLQYIMGIFVNTLALRNQPAGDKRFNVFLGVLKDHTLKAFANQEYQFEDLIDRVAVNRDVSRSPLFDVMFVLQNVEMEAGQLPEVRIPGLILKSYGYKNKTAKFDLTLFVVELENKLSFIFQYCTKLFKNATIEKYIDYFKTIVSSVLEDPTREIAHIGILPEEEKRRLLDEFNPDRDTCLKDDSPGNKPIHLWFEDQVVKNPAAEAISFREEYRSTGTGDTGTMVTYNELNQRANRAARLLMAEGVKQRDIVGILAKRSVEMITVILAVLKAGAAYVPIDPEFPAERIDYMVKDTNMAVLVSLQQFRVSDGLVSVVFPDMKVGEIRKQSKENPGTAVDLQDFAYIIYTSGSTGRPKGTPISHKNVNNYAGWFKREFRVTGEDRFCFTGSFCFDMAVTSTVVPLVCGAAVYTVGDRIEREPEWYTRYLAENKISIIKLTPTQFRPLLDYSEHVNLDSLRYIILGGEALDLNDVHRHLAIYKHHGIVNEYGPTEATVATIFHVFKGDIPFERLPIGKPISFTQVYIMDRYSALVPIGVVGEICIGGISVAKGYLNRVELTCWRFIRNPFSGSGSREFQVLYKTGDMGRYLEDGNIEYVGRIDSQVKIKGYRIELGEIEAVLSGCDGVLECAVAVKQDRLGVQSMVAYVVFGDGGTAYDAKEYLRARLPEYMIPPVFVPLSQLPVAVSGKTDRKKLSDPASLQISAREEYRDPFGEKETILADTWKEVLGIDRVGGYDNFFELGGDSIKAIQVISRLRKLQFKLEVNDLFLYPFVRQLKKCLKKAERIGYQGIVEGEAELTPIQHWFFENYYFNYKKDFALLEHFNQSVMLYRKEGFDPGTVETVFTGIVRHHDALRMVYRPGDEAGRIVQENRGLTGKLFHLETIDLHGEADIEKRIGREAECLQREIDLKEGPLVRLGLFITREGDHLLIVIHHLVVDGVSWRILLEDFALGYQQVMNRQPITFQEKTDSFRYWAAKLAAYAEGGAALKELEYWKTLKELNAEELPVDHPLPGNKNRIADRETVTMGLPAGETGKLLRQVNQAYNTELNDVLLAGLALAIKEWAGLNRLLLNLEGHGREEIIEDEDVSISRTVGWYTTQFPVAFDLTRCGELPYFLKLVKETLRNIPKRGIGYGILRCLAPVEKQDIAVEPQISFNYLGEFGQESSNNNGMFSFSRFSTGPTVNPGLKGLYRLDINGMTVSGKLTMSFSYNTHEYRRASIEDLVNLYRSCLLDIIDHCTGGKERELTPSDLDYREFTIDELHELQRSFHDRNCFIENVYRLSPMQSGMYYHYLASDEPSLYFQQYEIRLKGRLDREVLEKSLGILQERYDVLRTVFVQENLSEPVQIVLKARKPDIRFVDIPGLKENEQVEYVNTFKQKDREEGFELSVDRLMRISLLKIAEDSYKVVWSFHHIVMDGWCIGIIFKDLVRIYISLREQRPVELEPVRPYGEFIRWLEQQDREEGLKFWENYLYGYEQSAALPRLREPESFDESQHEYQYRVAEYGFEIDRELTRDLIAVANENHVTLNTLVQVLWGILLQKINRTDDVVFGGVVSGRPHEIEDVETMVGLFINTIPVRIVLTEGTIRFRRLIREVQQKSILARSYEYLPLAEIESCSPLKNRLIDHIMIFENYPVQDELRILTHTNPTGFEIREIEVFEQTNYDFNLFVVPGESIAIRFSYNSLVYDRGFIKKIALYFKELMRQVKENSDIDVREIEIFPQPAEASGVKSTVFDEEEGDFGF